MSNATTYDARDIKHLTGVAKSNLVLDVQRNGRSKPRPTKRFCNAVGRLYDSGLSLRTISEPLGINHNVLRDLIRDYTDVELRVSRKKGFVKDRIQNSADQVTALLDEGLSAEKIGKALNLGAGYVVKCGRKRGYLLVQGQRSLRHVDDSNIWRVKQLDLDLTNALHDASSFTVKSIRGFTNRIARELFDIIENPNGQRRSYDWHLDHVFGVSAALDNNHVSAKSIVLHPGNYQIISVSENTLRAYRDPRSWNLDLVLDRIRKFNFENRLLLKSKFPVCWDQHWKWI